jgi:MscS family membrane protein
LGVDQPFREGDIVLVDGVTGTVETIGLRSTRIRTFDRTLVAIPNGKLAEMRTETLTARDRFRLHARLALRPDTTPAVLRAFLLDAEKLMREHEKADTDASARVVAVGPASIDVEVIVSFLTTSAVEFGTIRQEILLGVLEALERAGTSIAPAAPVVAPGRSP